MKLEYRLYIRLEEINSISELGARVTELEEIDRLRRDRQKEEKKANGPVVATAAYSREECC